MWDQRKGERVFFLVDKKEVMGKEVEGCNEGKRKHKKPSLPAGKLGLDLKVGSAGADLSYI